MDILKKIAVSVAISATLVACGGGGDDSAGASSQPAPVIPTTPEIKPLTAVVEVQPTLKDLSKDWPTGVTLTNSTTLTFAGIPNLVKGDVFVVNNKAYKVESIGGTPSATKVTVSEPALNEVYKKLEFSGKSDALEFIPNPELSSDSTSSPTAVSSRGFKSATAVSSVEADREIKVTAGEDGTLSVGVNSEGFYTTKITLNHKFTDYKLETKGALTVGSKMDIQKWDAISNEGKGQIDVFMQPEAVLSLLKSEKELNKDGICGVSKEVRGKARVLLGVIPLGKVLAASTPIVGPIVGATFNLNMPVCMSFNVKSDMSLDFIELKGKYQMQVQLGGKQAPRFNNNSNSLAITAPASTATLSEATSQTAIMYNLGATADIALETSIELGDKLGVINTGVMVSAIARGELEGRFGVGLLKRKLVDIKVEPEACLTFKGKGLLQSKAQVSGFFFKEPLDTVSEAVFYESDPLTLGLCQCPEGSVMSNGKCEAKPIVCPTGQVLVNGVCQENPKACPTGQVLVNGVCKEESVQCPAGTKFENGQCEDIISEKNCEEKDNALMWKQRDDVAKSSGFNSYKDEQLLQWHTLEYIELYENQCPKSLKNIELIAGWKKEFDRRMKSCLYSVSLYDPDGKKGYSCEPKPLSELGRVK